MPKQQIEAFVEVICITCTAVNSLPQPQHQPSATAARAHCWPSLNKRSTRTQAFSASKGKRKAYMVEMQLGRDVCRALALLALVNVCLMCVPAHGRATLSSEEPLVIASDVGGEHLTCLSHFVLPFSLTCIPTQCQPLRRTANPVLHITCVYLMYATGDCERPLRMLGSCCCFV